MSSNASNYITQQEVTKCCLPLNSVQYIHTVRTYVAHKEGKGRGGEGRVKGEGRGGGSSQNPPLHLAECYVHTSLLPHREDANMCGTVLQVSCPSLVPPTPMCSPFTCTSNTHHDTSTHCVVWTIGFDHMSSEGCYGDNVRVDSTGSLWTIEEQRSKTDLINCTLLLIDMYVCMCASVDT